MNASSPSAYTIAGIDSMQADRAAPLPLTPVGDKAVDLDFAGGRLSSEAGLVLLKDPDEQLGLTRALAAVRSDPRDARRGNVTQHDRLKQRVLHMAAGYEDAHDANTLRHDPICKLRLDRLPETGAPLASQPTLSRFANRVSRPALSRMALVWVEPLLASSSHPPQVIVLAVDDTEDRAHGQQEQGRYDAYYGGYCFLPLPLYEGLSGRLSTAMFKAKRGTGAPRLAVLQRLGKRLRHAWPHTLGMVRGASHLASPEVRPWSEAQAHLSSVTGLTSQAVLQALARAVVAQAQRAYGREGGKITRCHSTWYQAGTWSRARRVVIKVAVSDPGVNPRFVVTEMAPARPQVVYRHLYGARGQRANEIKEHQLYLKSARTACHRFEANQWRLLLHAAASVLLETLRREVLRTTQWASATMETIQWRLRKLGARGHEGKERLTIALPSSCPVAPVLRHSLTLLACVRLTSQAL